MLDDKAQLEKGMQILGFENIPQIISKLLIYKKLLIKWNNSFNLTSVKNTEIVTHHFLDCLAVIPFIKSSTLLDVGTGAGLPGIVIAIVNPWTSFVIGSRCETSHEGLIRNGSVKSRHAVKNEENLFKSS